MSKKHFSARDRQDGNYNISPLPNENQSPVHLLKIFTDAHPEYSLNVFHELHEPGYIIEDHKLYMLYYSSFSKDVASFNWTTVHNLHTFVSTILMDNTHIWVPNNYFSTHGKAVEQSIFKRNITQAMSELQDSLGSYMYQLF